MTSDALMTAQASSPVLRPRSATASLVIDAVTTTPWPMSMRTWDVVAPFLTSTTLPLSWLRALSFFNGRLLGYGQEGRMEFRRLSRWIQENTATIAEAEPGRK